MEDRLHKIIGYVSELKDVSIVDTFEITNDLDIKGAISIKLPDNQESLIFEVRILPEYPLKTGNSESITFINIGLLKYKHIMKSGSICIHTSHCTDLRKKIEIDFNSLKRWIWEYYINGKEDKHYEHLILNPSPIKTAYYSYLFTEVSHSFNKGDFGYFEYSLMSEGSYYGNKIYNNVVQEFKTKYQKSIIQCQWGIQIKSLRRVSSNHGIYIYIETPPANFEKFAFETWKELEPLISQDFLKFLYDFEVSNKNNRGVNIPLLLGYKITDNEIHWQTANLEIGNFPIYHKKENQKYIGYFDDRNIEWGITKNCSYKYFFGRGKMEDKISQGRILIIGVGAIGSMVATTLARGGCTKIDVVDFDVKEPENVCRAEYSFLTGINDKVTDISNYLHSISPFIDVKIIQKGGLFNSILKIQDWEKFEIQIHETEKKEFFNQYDLIFDCSTDNDLMFVLNQLELHNLISMAITNKAKSLVCSTEIKSYDWVINQFEKILDNDIEDLHYPTGCWSPTFKASYNDISVLVQYALKHINLRLSQDISLRNFVVETNTDNELNIKLKEF
ncbi:hypothetical protein GCM10011514_00990 [Emticicia aquatilis]|uniref:THIF-type NAD/FAD binding fold domain-containing protein n=1 Tax=Emticicia aquatilis TaxID=1537369 RepID=A0A917DI80_9BACT|nr:ThiF family adenylyltransferase [Emticicia aquatilis]GGD40714.1 hypothetical protein GCM10011514_00990 [Emticicia aquatilis]